MGKFLPGENFANFTICSHWRNIYHANFLSCVNDYIEDMATFTASVKFYSIEYFCNTKVHISGVGEIFVKRKFSRIWYYFHLCENNAGLVSYVVQYDIAGIFACAKFRGVANQAYRRNFVVPNFTQVLW